MDNRAQIVLHFGIAQINMCKEQPLVNKPLPTLILQLWVLADLSASKEGHIFPFDAKCNEINIYFPIICVKTLMLQQLVNVLFAIKFAFDFLHSPNIHKLWDNILKYVVLYIILVRLLTIVYVVREITRMNKIWKRIILESDRECSTTVLFYTMHVFGKLRAKDTIQQF